MPTDDWCAYRFARSEKPGLGKIIDAHDEKKDGQRSQKGRHPAGFFGFLFLCHKCVMRKVCP